MESMELQVNTAASHMKEVVSAEAAPRQHDREATIATEGLGRVAQLRLRAQIKLIETLPVLGPFLETQAACACKAGCPTCAGPTLGTAAWATTKTWFGNRFSRSSKEPEELPSLSEGRIDFVMPSFEGSGFPHPAPEPIDPEEIVEEFNRQQEETK